MKSSLTTFESGKPNFLKRKHALCTVPLRHSLAALDNICAITGSCFKIIRSVASDYSSASTFISAFCMLTPSSSRATSNRCRPWMRPGRKHLEAVGTTAASCNLIGVASILDHPVFSPRPALTPPALQPAVHITKALPSAVHHSYG